MDRAEMARLAAIMADEGWEVNVEADLCRLVEAQPEKMEAIAQTKIVACHQRTIKSHLDSLGLSSEENINFRSDPLQQILERLGVENSSPSAENQKKYEQMIASLPVETGSDAWYPTLDKDRCTECGKCFDFCLFGVYAKENGVVKVSNPTACKIDCPACARTCPQLAVIFPKYPKSPINGGTELEETFSKEEKDEMYKQRILYKLQQRRRKL
ncbi:MAG: ATP-binding protein [Mangrovibacterium sp.]